MIGLRTRNFNITWASIPDSIQARDYQASLFMRLRKSHFTHTCNFPVHMYAFIKFSPVTPQKTTFSFPFTSSPFNLFFFQFSFLFSFFFFSSFTYFLLHEIHPLNVQTSIL